jgi:hypothetical protein
MFQKAEMAPLRSRGRPRKRLTPDQEVLATQMLRAGATVAQLTETLCLSEPTVRRLLRQHPLWPSRAKRENPNHPEKEPT